MFTAVLLLVIPLVSYRLVRPVLTAVKSDYSHAAAPGLVHATIETMFKAVLLLVTPLTHPTSDDRLDGSWPRRQTVAFSSFQFMCFTLYNMS